MKVPLREGLFFAERESGIDGVGGGMGEEFWVGALVEPHTVREWRLKKVVIHDRCLGNNLSQIGFFFLREGGEGREVGTREEEGLKGPGSPEGNKEDEGII